MKNSSGSKSSKISQILEVIGTFWFLIVGVAPCFIIALFAFGFLGAMFFTFVLIVFAMYYISGVSLIHAFIAFYKKLVEVNCEIMGDRRLSKTIGDWDPLKGDGKYIKP